MKFRQVPVSSRLSSQWKREKTRRMHIVETGLNIFWARVSHRQRYTRFSGTLERMYKARSALSRVRSPRWSSALIFSYGHSAIMHVREGLSLSLSEETRLLCTKALDRLLLIIAIRYTPANRERGNSTWGRDISFAKRRERFSLVERAEKIIGRRYEIASFSATRDATRDTTYSFAHQRLNKNSHGRTPFSSILQITRETQITLAFYILPKKFEKTI